jgi:hypothetical protein
MEQDMSSIQNHPFLFFFIDDLLPDCFGQKKGMTFRSLLTDEPITDKITYDGIKQSFQNLHAEFEAFDSFYEKLKTITDRNDFFRQQFIGKNKKTRTRGNNLFELVFSQDGRMDVSIIQNNGINFTIMKLIFHSYSLTRHTMLSTWLQRGNKSAARAFLTW